MITCFKVLTHEEIEKEKDFESLQNSLDDSKLYQVVDSRMEESTDTYVGNIKTRKNIYKFRKFNQKPDDQ